MNELSSMGFDGESAVADLLEKQGFSILVRNYRQRFGEIDLIAMKEETICFVEVKTRRLEYFATSQVVNKSKQEKIIKTAKKYTLTHNIYDKILRFDIAVVTGSKGNFSIRYLANAFNNSRDYPY
jgi:putative endonuclease